MTSQERTQRGANPSDTPLIDADGELVLDKVTNGNFARRRADDLDAEAAYYGHRAIQEEQALGSGYYVDLLRGMATDRGAMAQRIRTANGMAR